MRVKVIVRGTPKSGKTTLLDAFRVVADELRAQGYIAKDLEIEFVEEHLAKRASENPA